MLPNHQGCVSCVHRDSCTESRWNEARHPDARPSTTEPEDISTVHTCKTCGEKVFSSFTDGATTRLIVPDDCPRWDARSGCATDCNGCRKEKDDLKKLHPKYAERMLSAQAMLAVIGDGNPDELARRRKRKSASEEMLMAMMPGASLTDPVLGQKAHDISQALIGDLIQRCPAEWAKLDTNPAMVLQVEAVEWVYLALQRHPTDPEAVAHEFKLQVTDVPGLSWGWVRMAHAERKLALRVWSAIVEEAA